MTRSILYCGDTALSGAAGYLAGLMSAWGWDYRYVASDEALSTDDLEGRSLIIVSDYPAARVDDSVQRQLVAAVASGTGLLMIGGWESYHGLGGNWDTTVVAAALPVVMQSSDDRMNCDHPVLLRVVEDHPIVAGLPWDDRPPFVGGFNRFKPCAESKVLLEGDRTQLSFGNGQWNTEVVETHPLLVVGQHRQGRTAAIATDVAPHWVGGLVDWGDERVKGKAAGADEIEVGDLYARFWRQLLSYVRTPD